MNDDYRAAMVAAIRALADFVETRTDLPVPNDVSAQHSILGEPTPDNCHVIRDAADKLGVDPRVSDVAASAGYEISTYPVVVRYTVHGFLADAEAEAE